MENIFLGIDVGTGSVRVGAFDSKGYLRGLGIHEIKMWQPQPDHVEQSSEDIWTAAGQAVQKALTHGNIDPVVVKGMSFDATCSLVALSNQFKPITVSTTNKKDRNVIVWMDHRAVQEAKTINTAGHEVLKYVGGTISPEMQPPKLMWLKKHLPGTWKKAEKFMDLADYMVFRATGNDRRSLCTSVCKWTYLGHEKPDGRYDEEFFTRHNIEDLFRNDRVPQVSHPMGQLAGELTVPAAETLGLRPGTAVGVGIIDAHAGGIGVLGSLLSEDAKGVKAFDRAMALIGGTSSCHMAVSKEPRFIPGVWGPYYGAMLPGMWLNEGGQSATGSLIDHVIRNNASHMEMAKEAKKQNTDIYTYLNRLLDRLIQDKGMEIFNTRHMLPDYHGNRSPRADAGARGMVSGLNLNVSSEEVAFWYGAAIQAIAHGTRHIIEEMNNQGYAIEKIFMCGGHLKNERFIKEHADITGCPVVIPRETEAVLLGSAILGAVAAGAYKTIFDAMGNMCRTDRVVEPDLSLRSYHDAKYEIYKEMAAFQKKIHETMANRSE